MHNQHRMYRVFQMIKELQSGENKSHHYLSKTLKITVRSVYRYLELLEEVGLKVEQDERGKLFLVNDINSILHKPNESN
jgi:predicted DNA-binding transcriptional regulator YafY